MRNFITLEFDMETKKDICEVQNIIRRNSERGRFKYIDNFHLTLKFLGETRQDIVDSIYSEMSGTLSDLKPIEVKLNGIGSFGSGRIIKTIYIKVEEISGNLITTASKINNICKSYGFKDEKRFVPHITIAQDVELIKPFEEIAGEINQFFYRTVKFDRITIMKSEEISRKRIYTPIKVLNLK